MESPTQSDPGSPGKKPLINWLTVCNWLTVIALLVPIPIIARSNALEVPPGFSFMYRPSYHDQYLAIELFKIAKVTALIGAFAGSVMIGCRRRSVIDGIGAFIVIVGFYAVVAVLLLIAKCFRLIS